MKIPYRLSAWEWVRVVVELFREMKEDHISILTAALAFYAVLAIFPALIAIVSVYGLFLDPTDIQAQIAPLTRLLPESAAEVVTRQLHDLVERHGAGLGIGLLISLIAMLWGVSKGVNALFTGVNIAYFAKETRGVIRRRALAFVATLGLIGFAVLALAAVAVLPPLFEWLGLPPFVEIAVGIARWPVLAVLVVLGLGWIYRYGPDHPVKPPFRWVTPGSLVATTLWLLGSIAFSVYTAHFDKYNEIYGALGAMILLLLWLWLSAFAILLGAELNSVLEKRAGLLGEGRTFSTVGPGDMLPSDRRWAPPATGS